MPTTKVFFPRTPILCKMKCQLQKQFLFKDPNFDHFFNFSHFSKSFTKINIAFPFSKFQGQMFRIPLILRAMLKIFSFSALYKFQNVLIVFNISNISKFQLCTSSRLCSLYFNVKRTSTFLLFYTG